MIAIFFSRPLTLTISCFAITSLLQELLRHRAAPASRWARRLRCAQINVGICGMAPGMMAHNSLSNTILVVASASANREQVHNALDLLGLTGGRTQRSIAIKGHKTQKSRKDVVHKKHKITKRSLTCFCAFLWGRISVVIRR